MNDAVMLDTSILGMIAHPNANPPVTKWIADLLAAGVRVILPEIADYELRRELIVAGLKKSLIRLDELKAELEFMPLTSEVMKLAAQLWADSRSRGKKTADDKELDGDAILAALALTAGAIVATTNIGHLGQWVTAKNWPDIQPPADPASGEE